MHAPIPGLPLLHSEQHIASLQPVAVTVVEVLQCCLLLALMQVKHNCEGCDSLGTSEGVDG
jgi:hypothetical protein